MMGIKEGLLLWSASLPDKYVLGSGVNIEVKHNEQLAKELHKPIIRNF